MIETTQLYIFEDSTSLNLAVNELDVLSPDQFSIMEAGPADGAYHLKVWFSDVETAMVPFVTAAFPVVNE